MVKLHHNQKMQECQRACQIRWVLTALASSPEFNDLHVSKLLCITSNVLAGFRDAACKVSPPALDHQDFRSINQDSAAHLVSI